MPVYVVRSDLTYYTGDPTPPRCYDTVIVPAGTEVRAIERDELSWRDSMDIADMQAREEDKDPSARLVCFRFAGVLRTALAIRDLEIVREVPAPKYGRRG